MIALDIKIPLHIQQRGLQRVTSIDKNAPDGLFSSAIFGVTQEERRTKGAYIALNCHVVRPNVLKIFTRISRNLNKCATEKTVHVLTSKGELLPIDKFKALYGEPTNELKGYGPEFLYAIWEKIDTKKIEPPEHGQHIGKEMKRAFFKKHKDNIFTSFQYVRPLGFREEPEDTSSMIQNEVNQYLSDIIKYSNVLESQHLEVDMNDIHILIQKAVLTLYNFNSDREMGPKGVARKQIMARTVANSCRLTIIPPVYNSPILSDTNVSNTSCGIPIYHIINLFKDFFIKYSKDFLSQMFERGLLHENALLESYDTEYLTHIMSDMEVPHFRVQPFKLLLDDGTDAFITLKFDSTMHDGTKVTEEKILSNMEFFFIVATKYIDVFNTKACAVTR